MPGDRDRDFEVYFRAEYAAIQRTIFALTADRAAADDCAQEAFARLYSHWRTVSRYERPGAWVRRVAINLAVSGLRQRRYQTDVRATPDPADPDLHRAILALPRMQRAAIVLHYFEDRPVAEVAEMLGCSSNTVKVHLHRARRTLGESLKEGVDES